MHQFSVGVLSSFVCMDEVVGFDCLFGGRVQLGFVTSRMLTKLT